MPELIEVVGGEVRLHPHPGQFRALQSRARIIPVISGAQGGKTALGPIWLWQEMMRRGSGDYLVVTPTFPLLYSSALPKLKHWFEEVMRLGKYVESPTKRLVISQDGERSLWGHKQATKTTIRCGHASDPHALEALTLKGLWADEAGQPEFRQATWDNLYTRRLAIHQGRALITTTPYSIEGWLRELCDQAERGEIDAELIRFDSTTNPAFPREAWEEAQRVLPGWKFDLMFRGLFSRPAGLIYDAFVDALAPAGHLLKRFPIPAEWHRVIGLDFGGINTAGSYWAQERRRSTPEEREKGAGEWASPTGRWLLYRTYHAGNKTAKEHVDDMLRDEPVRRVTCVGGSKSEGQWRSEWRAAGLAVKDPPIKTGGTEGIVESGILRCYAAFRESQIGIFDDLSDFLKQLRGYSREVDALGNPTEAIANKAAQHYMDSMRYAFAEIRSGHEPNVVKRGRTVNPNRFVMA